MSGEADTVRGQRGWMNRNEVGGSCKLLLSYPRWDSKTWCFFFFFSFKRKYFRINYLPYIVTQLARCLCMYGLRVSGLYPFFLCGWYGENAFQCVPCTLASFGLMTTESVGSIEL